MYIKENNNIFSENEIKYLELLSTKYPTINDVCTEIINLEAILNLPKGTEHFLSDIHGEYEAFSHVLKNASGVIKEKIEIIFGRNLRDTEKKELATLIYYPEEKMQLIEKKEKYLDDWYKITLYRLIEVCKLSSSKYTRSKVRKSLPKEFEYILEELINEKSDAVNKEEYYDKIIQTIIKLHKAKDFIISICKLIQRFAIDHLHIIGDIYDRGKEPYKIMEILTKYHSIDIQWGNHDIVWMGAAAGSKACIANTIRNSIKYGNHHILEEDYGINLVPLATFASEIYKDDDCKLFMPSIIDDKLISNKELNLLSKMHKAITIIQLKIEGKIIKKFKDFEMEDRLLLHKIDFKKKVVIINKKEYKLLDTNFPTIDPNDPYKLTNYEEEVIDKLKTLYLNNEKLQEHIRFLFNKGSMYLKHNSNLLYHGCIPTDENGDFTSILINNEPTNGKKLINFIERNIREGYFNRNRYKDFDFRIELMWYLWCGKNSPLFGKTKMATFERYFIQDEKTHEEKKNAYYKYRDDENYCNKVLKEFNLDPSSSRIINGHVPVKVKKGESPIKANSKLLVIDGGFSKAYQKHTGIAGYTLIYSSYGYSLISHESFESKKRAVEEEKDIYSSSVILEYTQNRKRVKDTDVGYKISENIKYLEQLLIAYRNGFIKEKK